MPKMTEITPEEYWHVQADMWRQNYSDAEEECKQLRSALEAFVEAQTYLLKLDPNHEGAVEVIVLWKGMVEKAKEALNHGKNQRS